MDFQSIARLNTLWYVYTKCMHCLDCRLFRWHFAFKWGKKQPTNFHTFSSYKKGANNKKKLEKYSFDDNTHGKSFSVVFLLVLMSILQDENRATLISFSNKIKFCDCGINGITWHIRDNKLFDATKKLYICILCPIHFSIDVNHMKFKLMNVYELAHPSAKKEIEKKNWNW